MSVNSNNQQTAITLHLQREAELQCLRERVAALDLKLQKMAAENAGMKVKGRELLGEACAVYAKLNKLIDPVIGDFIDGQTLHEFQFVLDCETPATDAFLVEVRAQARNEGINYAGSRLAAAFNHGFVDKPLTEVCDVVRMILETKKELANSTQPAADGLSGEYAEKFLEDSAAQLRESGAEKQSILSDEDCHAFVKAFTKGAAK